MPIGRGNICAVISAPAELNFSTSVIASGHIGSPALPVSSEKVTGRAASAATSNTCRSTVS